MIGARRRRVNRLLRRLRLDPSLVIIDVGGHRNRPLPPHVSIDPDPARGADLCASGEALPLPDASVDVVVCLETWQYVASPGRCVSEARRVLRPGGRLVVTVPTARAVAPPLRALEYPELFALLYARGFRPVEVASLGGTRTRWVDEQIVRLGRAARLLWPLWALLAVTDWSRYDWHDPIGWWIVAEAV